MSSIRTKTTVSLLFVVISVISLYGVNDYLHIKKELYSELEVDSRRKTDRLAENLLIPLWEMDEKWIDSIITTEMEDKNIYAIIVTGEDELRVQMSRDEQWKTEKEAPFIGEDYIFQQRNVLHDDEKIGQVFVYITTKFINESLENKLLELLLSMLVLSCFIIVFLQITLQRIVIKPLNHILMAVQTLAGGDYDTSLRINSNDEIGLLTQGFNNMRKRIKLRQTERDNAMIDLQQSKNELLHLNETLELRVSQRTADLEKTNQHLQEMSAAFEKSKNDAEAANRSKSIFLANMSHELRTPMNAVLGFSRLMQGDPGLSAEQKEYLNIINRSGSHLLNLINDVLDMAKIESGRIELENEPFDLSILIQDIINLMHQRAEKKDLLLSFDQSSSFPRVINSDAGKIRQILVNLLGNAIKCTDQGSVSLRLNTQPHERAQHVMLIFEVEDTGQGIAKEDLPLIFSSFIQVGEQAKQDGTGLGLAITQQYVELMGGEISVNSELGKGSVFRVKLPIQRMDEDAILSVPYENTQKIIAIQPRDPEYRVLIVEDQLENRLLLTRLLERVGFEVQAVEDGLQGVAVFKSWNPDFIWMDRRMPVMDGIEATRRIRSLPGGEQVFIVAVTASVFEQERSKLIQAGVNEIVNKPFHDQDIFDCMAKYLDVKYIYQHSENKALSSGEVELSEEQLRTIPGELLDQLSNAVESLDIEASHELIDKISLINSAIALTMRQLVDQFNFQLLAEKLNTRAG